MKQDKKINNLIKSFKFIHLVRKRTIILSDCMSFFKLKWFTYFVLCILFLFLGTFAQIFGITLMPEIEGNMITLVAHADSIPENIQMGECVKVGLRYGSNAVTSFQISCDGGFLIGEIEENNENGDGESIAIRQIIYNDALTVESSTRDGANTYLIKDSSTSELLAEGLDERNCIIPLYYLNGYVMKIENSSYRGAVCVTFNSNGSMNILNYLNMDQYVYGVLNAELNYTNPIEALKAQAVAARSFAASASFEGGRHKDYGFDVCASTHCQVYRGYDDEKSKTNEAVDLTYGLVLYYENKPVMAYYHKNSGGFTQNVRDVWGSDIGYLESKKDTYSPKYYWEKSYSFADLENLLLSKGEPVGTLQRVAITKRSANGYVSELTFYGSSQNRTYKSEQIRTLLGYSDIKSMNFVFSGEIIADTSETTINPNPIFYDDDTILEWNGEIKLKDLFVLKSNSSNNTSSISDLSKFYIIGRDNKTKKIDDKNTFVYDGKSLYKIADTMPGTYDNQKNDKEKNKDTNDNNDKGNNQGQLDFYYLKGFDEVSSGEVKFTGLGYGHGIGMPQDSAVQMANQGFTFDEILLYYYTDIEIK